MHSSLTLRRIRHVAMDMDGTIYLGSRLFDTTLGFLDLLRRRRIGYSFLTNNSSHSRGEYLRRLQALGVPATLEQIYTSTPATVAYLREHMPDTRRLFVLGTPAMQKEVRECGFDLVGSSPDDPPEAVVVGFDRTLTYERLCLAAWWIKQGRPFIATHPDRVCPTDAPTVLVDCGAICQALTTATGVTPIVIGKPDPRMLAGLRHCYHLAADEIAMVGDRLSTDMALARQSGALGVLVLTGEATREQAATSEWKPDLIVADLAELGRKLIDALEQEVRP